MAQRISTLGYVGRHAASNPGGNSPNRIPNKTYPSTYPSIGGLSVRGVGAIVGTTGFTANPGDIVTVNRAVFSYAGPAQAILLAVAWKGAAPGGAGLNFNNGDNVMTGAGMWKAVQINLAASLTVYTNVDIAFTLNLLVPTIGSHSTVGGGTVNVNKGALDTWVWVANADGVTDSTVIAQVGKEANFIQRKTGGGLIDTDSGVVNVQPLALAISTLNVGYVKV